MRILVVEDDLVTRLAVKAQLENPGTEVPVAGSPYVVTAVGGRAEAEAALDQHAFDYAFIDLKLGHDRHAGQELLQTIVRNHPSMVCIMMTSNSADQAVETCLRNGAAEYIIKPFEHRIVHDIMRKAGVVHRLWQSHRALRLHAGKGAVDPIRLASKSPTFQKVIESAKRLKGKQNLAVFISGESGVGKEVMARFLWTLEDDCTRVFMPVHTGALPKDLVESELFGFKKGAFSGAIENKVGKFEAADGGDIFLDEVATMPLETQVKLLRVLQEKEVVPLGSGSAQPKKINVRVISATNESLPDLVKEKRFREDLYFRLKMVTLEIPPLRERMEDLDDLVALFLRKAIMSHKRLSVDAWDLCRTYQWPGNVRELENALTVAAELAEGDEIFAKDILPNLEHREGDSSHATAGHGSTNPYGLTDEAIEGGFPALTDKFEREIIRHALNRMKSVTHTARFLRIPRTTLISKMNTWGWKE